eukprot:COSAG02_NODE_65602_length_257_cov_1.310127_1_plen_85_part_11
MEIEVAENEPVLPKHKSDTVVETGCDKTTDLGVPSSIDDGSSQEDPSSVDDGSRQKQVLDEEQHSSSENNAHHRHRTRTIGGSVD